MAGTYEGGKRLIQRDYMSPRKYFGNGPGRTSRAGRRSCLAAVAAALPAALLLTACSGDSSSDRAATTTTTQAAGESAPVTITVLGSRSNTGPFARALSLKLDDTTPKPMPFYVCAAWGEQQPPGGCEAADGARLPVGGILRLEQQPPGPAVTYPDSPGWGTVGTSDTPELTVPLSNGTTGNKFGTVTYRVTMRNRAGKILANSNRFVLTWHR
jgi:hypothetical protein